MAAPDPQLLFDAAVVLATSAIYFGVGRLMARRPVHSREATFATRMFALWWLALSGATAVGGLQTLLFALDARNVPLEIALTYLGALLLPVALLGLLYYLLYIYLGKEWILWPLSALYAGILVFFFYAVAKMNPTGIERRGWTAGMGYANTLTPLEMTLALAALLAPILLAAIAYGSLYFRVTDRTRRFRIALVSMAFLGWFGSAAVGSIAGLGEVVLWPLVSRMIGLAATSLILLAYRPPRWLRERFAIQGLENGGDGHPQGLSAGQPRKTLLPLAAYSWGAAAGPYSRTSSKRTV
ncbi:MAG TPA: hypothetical protein VNZ52_12470 [Candidatus Thermoplasmatota archaeon]|nr:hypothetical protein [Candidatus Thermoplasmatota archaeon]